MRTALACVLLVLLCATPALTAEPGEWIPLLPDNDLKKHWTTTGNWAVEPSGVIRLTPRPGEKGWTRYDAYLWHLEEYRNFEVDFEYQLEAKGNSGFYFHVADPKNPVQEGIEVQIYDSYSTDPQARLTDHTSGGVIPGIAPTKNAAKAPGEWNRFQIQVLDRKLTVRLNGELVNEVTLGEGRLADRPETGVIGFQDHGLPLALRNIKIRKL